MRLWELSYPSMKPRSFKSTVSISLSILLISSLFFIANSNVSHASSTGSDEVNAASGSNRFIVWSDKTPGNWEIFFRRSTDNAATWKPIVNLSNNPGSSLNPAIVVSGSNVYIVWAQANAANTQWDINFRRSTDNGVTWKPVVTVAPNIGGSYIPQVMSSGSSVYVIWEQAGEIYLRRSADSGTTWKPIFNVSANPGASTDEQIAVSGANVYVVWSQRAASGSSTDVFFRRSSDNGATWKAKVNLSNSGQAYSSPEMAVSGPNIHVVWVEDSDIFTRSTSDSGATWKSVKSIVSSSPEYFSRPQVATSGSNAYVVFQEETNLDEISTATCGGNTQIELQFAASIDSGVTWKPPVTISKTYSSCGESWFDSRIIALGSNVYVLWRVGAHGFGESHFRASTDNGATWDQSFPLLTASGPGPGIEMAASGPSVYLVLWSAGEVYLYRSLDNGATLQPKMNLSNNSRPSNNAQFAV